MEELNPCNNLATSSGFKNKNYIAGSACWQYGTNTVFWLATRASMMGTWAWSGLTKFVIFLENFLMESQKAAAARAREVRVEKIKKVEIGQMSI